MKARRGFNPKRRIAPADHLTPERRKQLADIAMYGGNPEHKRSPADYGLIPSASPRPGKTLCDGGRPITRQEAIGLLRHGLLNGMVRACGPSSWPQNVWAISGTGECFEAQLENVEQGVYHGYPMPQDDNFRRIVIAEWTKRVGRADI